MRGALKAALARLVALMAPSHRLMLAAVFFTGLAHIAFLPPLEGFDEEAHWSSIALIAEQGRIPIYGQDRLDRNIETYPGPHPYANRPPFEQTRGVNYRTYDPATMASPHTRVPASFSQGSEANWQAQHPPLYYLALAPIKRAVDGWSWAAQFFTLRLASWLFAFGGLVIAVEALRARAGLLPAGGAVVAAAWPFLFPQFFPEMARLGNDSLCLLLAGLATALLVHMESATGRLRNGAALGLVLGLGLWTKAFFLPITAGLAAYFLWRAWLERGERPTALSWLASGGTAIGLAIGLGGAWYVYKAVTTGDLTGGDEFVRLGQDTFLVSGLLAHFDPTAFARGLAAIAASFAWAGSWSLARPPEIFILGPVLLMVLVLVRWALQARTLPRAALLPAFIGVPMVAGLVFHLLVRMAAGEGGAGTPGWYLHILAPIVALAVCWGWKGSLIAKLLAAYTVAFTALAWALQLSLFSGCAAKLGTQKTYSFEDAACFIDVQQLSALAYPGAGFAFLAIGAAFGTGAVWRAWRTNEEGAARPAQAGAARPG